MSRHARFCAFSSLLFIIGVVPYTAFAGAIPNFTPQYSFDWNPVAEGGVYDLPLGGAGSHIAEYKWPGGRAIGILYKGTFQGGATQVTSHFLGSSGTTLEFSDHFTERGEYFVAIYHLPFFADPDWHASVDSWFRSGNVPGAFPPDSWGIVRFRVGVPAIAPSVSDLSQYRKFGIDEIPAGASFVGNEAEFSVSVVDPDSVGVRFEIELKTEDMPFDGEVTASASSTPGEVRVVLNELIPLSDHYVSDGNIRAFKWRARVVDEEGNESAWSEFGTDSLAADFTAKVVPLWTQVVSSFPSVDETERWSDRLYASGFDPDCSKDNPSNATIAKCGCAITSVVMVANYFGVQAGIDGQQVNPENINDWLILNNGYVGDNLVSWAKVEQYLGVNIGNEPHKLLAFDRANYKTTSSAVVDSYLTDEVPVIAYKGSVGHYFVMDSKVARADEATYTVRDPQWYRTETLDDAQDIPNKVKGYGNSFTHGTIFTKLASPTKIAAHVGLFLASPAEILVTDPLGRRAGKDPRTGGVLNEIPGALYALEDPILTSETDTDETSHHRVKSLQLPQLQDGNYRVEIIGTGEGEYELTALMTDATGSTTKVVTHDDTRAGDVSVYAFSVAEAPGPLVATIGELLQRLSQELATIDAKNAKAHLNVLQKQIDSGSSAANTIIEVLMKEIIRLGDKGEISAEVESRMMSWLSQIAAQI